MVDTFICSKFRARHPQTGTIPLRRRQGEENKKRQISSNKLELSILKTYVKEIKSSIFFESFKSLNF